MDPLTLTVLVLVALVVLAVSAMLYALASRYLGAVEVAQARWSTEDAARLRDLEGRFEKIESKVREAAALAGRPIRR